VPGDLAVRSSCLVDLYNITTVDLVWATCITHFPLQRSFLCLTVYTDFFVRHVLSWKLSTSLERDFCLEAPQMALAGGCRP